MIMSTHYRPHSWNGPRLLWEIGTSSGSRTESRSLTTIWVFARCNPHANCWPSRHVRSADIVLVPFWSFVFTVIARLNREGETFPIPLLGSISCQFMSSAHDDYSTFKTVTFRRLLFIASKLKNWMQGWWIGERRGQNVQKRFLPNIGLRRCLFWMSEGHDRPFDSKDCSKQSCDHSHSEK